MKGVRAGSVTQAVASFVLLLAPTMLLAAAPADAQTGVSAQQDPLTDDQRAWLDDNGPIRVGISLAGTASARLDDGELHGFFPDLLLLAALKVGAEVRFVLYNTSAEAEAAMFGGDVHVAGEMGERSTLAANATPSRVTSVVHMVVATTTAHTGIAGVGDLDGRRVGVILGSPAERVLDQNSPDAIKVGIDGFSDGVARLADGELEAMLGPDAAIGTAARLQGLDDIIPVGDALTDVPGYLWAPGGGNVALGIMDEGLGRISGPEATVIYVKNTGIDLSPAPPAPGLPRWVLWMAAGAAGAVVVLLGANVVLRREVRRRTDEVLRHRDTLETEVAERTKELRRSNRDLEMFASMASHDLQSPLRSVSGFLYLLDKEYRDELDEQAREYVDLATKEADRMSKLVHGMLQLGRVESTDGSFTEVSLAEACRSSLDDLAEEIGSRDADVDVGELPTVRADAEQMRQLFGNLIGNAVRYRHPDRPPRVTVRAEAHEDGWRVLVEDNGIGIPAEQQAAAFEPMRRLQADDEPGTGLGLAIAARIVEHHGGTIGVDSAPGQGSTFWFTLPADGRAERPAE